MTTQPPLRLLIPRAETQAKAFAAEISSAMPARWAIDIAPLFTIRPTGTPLHLSNMDALVFTSRNAVDAYAAAVPDRNLPAYCVGERTTATAQAKGLVAQNLGGDVAALAQALSQREPLRLLHVRGTHTTGDLGQLLAASGHVVQQVEVYDQSPCPLPARVLLRLAAGGYDVVTLFSPRTAELLASQAEAQGLSPNLTLLCLSPAVAAVAHTSHQGPVLVCKTPDAQAMLTALRAFARF